MVFGYNKSLHKKVLIKRIQQLKYFILAGCVVFGFDYGGNFVFFHKSEQSYSLLQKLVINVETFQDELHFGSRYVSLELGVGYRFRFA